MPNPELSPFAIRVSDLSQEGETPFEIVLDAVAAETVRENLALVALRKVRFKGHLEPVGKSDWQLHALLGATVVQPCVATLADVQTRIDVPVARTYVRDYADPDEVEVEIPDDDTLEPLGIYIDPYPVLVEALALALPLYPRADGNAPVSLQVTAPGEKPMTDDDAKPFAGLASLRDKLDGGA